MNMFEKSIGVPVLNVIEDMDGDEASRITGIWMTMGMDFPMKWRLLMVPTHWIQPHWPMLILSLFLTSIFLFLKTLLPVLWLEP